MAVNISETPLYAHAFFVISFDFINFQYSRKIYQGLTLKYHENLFSIC